MSTPTIAAKMKMPETKINEEIYDHRVLTDWSNVNVSNGTMHYSKDMIFNDGHRLSITVYSILFVISTIGNSTILFLLTKRRLRGPSRIDIMLMHLAIADLLVTFLLMPLEIAWAYTVQWRSTDFVCRTMSFFRVYGLYLSSFVLVCISIDRYYAIIKPLKLSTNRGRIMLAVAWCASVVCSMPQAFFFHLEEHPKVKGYFQCVTFHSFASDFHLLLYNMANMCVMYMFPLITFIYCYGAIYLEIYSKSQLVVKGVDRFRRSNDDVLGRAKKRTLKMTITIVIVFLVCWTPYYIMSMWYWFDKSSADEVSSLVSKGLFIFASTHSCMNPIVYGVFNIRGRVSRKGTSVTNRHSSLQSHSLDASHQLQKSLTNGKLKLLNNNQAIGGASVPANGIAVRHSVNQKERNGVGPSNGAAPAAGAAAGAGGVAVSVVDDISTLAKMSPIEEEKPPMICINCGDSVELSSSDKQP